MTTDNEKGPLNQMESGQQKRSASEARALSEIVNGTPSENLCRREIPAPEQASETTAQQPRTYTTQPAESVMGIALRQCGNEMEWRHILACNPEFARMLPHEYFPVGTVLNLPPPPAAASPVEQPEKSPAPEGGSEAEGRWIQANCPTGDIIKSPYPSNNREFPTSISESDCEHRIALAPSQPAAAPIEYRYEGGTHWCDLGPAERMRPDFKGVYRLKAGTFPVWAGDPAPSPADERAAWQTGAPPVKEGSYAGFIVACRRKHNGEVYVFEANYANQYAEELRDDDGEEFTAHGWYDVAQDIHGEYSSVFSKTCGEGDEIIGWQPLPKWIEESARAASANETGAEGADALAHEVWSAAQRAPGEGIEDAVQRIAAILSRSPAMSTQPVRAWETDDGRVISDEQKQGAQAADPVAWRYLTPTGWHATTKLDKALGASAHHDMEPLYAAPQPAQADARVGLTATQLATIRLGLTAAKSFIANGIELGFVRMPDADCPDPAHNTPKLIDDALALLAADPGQPEPRGEVTDTARLDWMIAQQAWIQWTVRDGSIRQCQVYDQDEDENYHTLSGDDRYFNTPREAIDAARAGEKQ
ncbi:hypothetical protein [Burkholderia vietnamiensis]|uniref:hypothetical protein n=1 Tax=Burkholderia vietnamiensis TaxID=60552 RepID=UPI001CF22C9C|nr:hypothetical protein [Burkholderia vietnamiensis]MCA7943224.1 hypothetical protein [Burkholderia vietnamiensis]